MLYTRINTAKGKERWKISEKEKQFIDEYKKLLEKYNVELVISQWSDEWGNHTDITFKEQGKYCTINYSPEVKQDITRRCGMGG